MTDAEQNVERSETQVHAWWFAEAGADGLVRLPHGDGREVRVGETLTVDGPIILCEQGLHASRRVLDALGFAPGPILCRVELSGTVVEGADKLAASARTVVAMGDVSHALHEFACRCAERALEQERAAGREPDPRSWAVVAAKRAWLRGELDDAGLHAAWAAAYAARETAAQDAARAAAWDAARDAAARAAWDAARDAAARDAARAAWAATSQAARAAASHAAWDAAWDAARDAASKAVQEAEKAWQEAELRSLVVPILGLEEEDAGDI